MGRKRNFWALKVGLGPMFEDMKCYDTYICVAIGPIGSKLTNQMAKFALPDVTGLSVSLVKVDGGVS